ncbi:hypothetical protein DOTSEDRAFT_69674 [Lecanosticta acicola]|uniref:SigF-like NTF2-like domain-containing protein n=1 Tax=Lecanosticta acicola TaxID=111012 RepID=A0AAI8YRW7_9PEZI|nr:hypothetical protein DOTSEDRAFT_69674 [Lecanosticta acicola]
MEDPIQEIPGVVHRLTQGSPKQQEEAINNYFTSNASFSHPLCRTGSFEGSRQLIHAIFRWYKVMSPKIELSVNGVAFDETNLILYVNISQVFAIWLVPFHRAPVTLTTQLQLVRGSPSRKYYIQSQNDLYQADQLVKFFAPWGIGQTFVLLVNFWATFLCVVMAWLGSPFTRYMQARADQGSQTNGEVRGITYQVNKTKPIAGNMVNGSQPNGERTQAILKSD